MGKPAVFILYLIACFYNHLWPSDSTECKDSFNKYFYEANNTELTTTIIHLTIQDKFDFCRKDV